MARISGNQPWNVIGMELCEILKIEPRNVRSFDLRIAVGEAVTIIVEFFPEYSDLDAIQGVLGKISTYTILENKDETDPEARSEEK